MPDTESRVSSLYLRLARLLQRNAPLHGSIDPKLGRAVHSALANPGGLFRAGLTFEASQACGLPDAQGESLACALEYFHVASLLFDDLPMMDNASMRRGEICAHLLHGEAATALAALALITRAYALAGPAITFAPDERQGPALALIERCLGTSGMLNGQARDLQFQAGREGARDAMAISLAKTVPLVRLSLLLPALLGGWSGAVMTNLRRLSVCWGLFYQGADDLGDLLESTKVSGKSSHQDQRLGRPNVARQLGLHRTRTYLHRLEQIAQRCIDAVIATNPGFVFLSTYHQLLTARLDRFPDACP